MLRSLLPAPRWLLGTASLLLLLATALSTPVHAQSTGDGSIYSRFGVGMLDTFSSSQSQALGGGAYALRSLNYNAAGNPALWSDQVFTRAHLGASFRSVAATDGTGESSQLTGGTLETLQFSFPLVERSVGVGLIFRPYSRSNYRAQIGGLTATGPSRQDTLRYQTNFEGIGGLQLLRGGVGVKVNEALRVGASVDVLFGILEGQRSTRFRRPGTSVTPTGTRDAVLTNGTRLSGVTGSLGAHLALADVLTGDDALSLGAAVTLPASLSGERVRTIDESLARDTLGTPVSGEIDLPWEVRAGLAYQPDERWTVVADGLYAPWSTASSDFGATATIPTSFPTGGTATLTDRWRLSAGAEVVPAGEDQFAGYFARTGYRFGAYVERLYVRPDRSTNLHTYALTGGLSLPASISGTRIDINGSVGRRGTTEGALVRDTFYSVSVHVSIGERWFQERKLR